MYSEYISTSYRCVLHCLDAYCLAPLLTIPTRVHRYGTQQPKWPTGSYKVPGPPLILSSAITPLGVVTAWAQFATGWTVRGLNLGGRKEIFSPPPPSRLTLGPTQLPLPREQGSFPAVKWAGHSTYHPTPSSTKVVHE